MPGDRRLGFHKPQPGETAQKCGEGNLGLTTGQRCADTKVDAIAECDVPVWGSSDVESIRLRELCGVPVRRAEHERDRLPFGN